jgi:hypothetical protein
MKSAYVNNLDLVCTQSWPVGIIQRPKPIPPRPLILYDNAQLFPTWKLAHLLQVLYLSSRGRKVQTHTSLGGLPLKAVPKFQIMCAHRRIVQAQAVSSELSTLEGKLATCPDCVLPFKACRLCEMVTVERRLYMNAKQSFRA